MAKSYVLYGPDPSLFTRKLEAALIFYGAPFERILRTRELRSMLSERSGSHQLPTLETPEGEMLSDTTPIMQLLDERFPERRMFPTGLAGVLVHLLEELLDEWVSRVCVHYRWHYPENEAFALAAGLAEDFAAEGQDLASWGRRACRATGTELPGQRAAAEAEYLAILATANEQLGRTRYLLGDRPCAVDAALLGSLRAHTHHDPHPDLSAFGRVVGFAEGERDALLAASEPIAFDTPTPFAEALLGIAEAHYAPFVVANRRAREAGEKAFILPVYGEEVSFMAREYPEWSRRLLAERVALELDGEQAPKLREWLTKFGLEEALGA